MSALVLTSGQVSIIQNVDADIQSALGGGCDDGSADVIVPPMPQYSAITSSVQQVVRNCYRGPFAALLVALNISAPLPTFENGLSTTIALAKLTTLGSNGSATFTAGILTGYVAPT